MTVSGTVYVVAGTYNSGTHYIQSANGGIQFFENGTGLVLGDVVEITGVVSAFSGEIQITSPSVSLTGQGPEIAATPMPMSTILADYEQVGNFVVDDRHRGRGDPSTPVQSTASTLSTAPIRSWSTSTRTRRSTWAPSRWATSTW